MCCCIFIFSLLFDDRCRIDRRWEWEILGHFISSESESAKFPERATTPCSMKVCRNARKTCEEPLRIHACLAGHVEGRLNIKVVRRRVQDEHMNVLGNGQLRYRIRMTRSIREPRQGRQQQPDRRLIVLFSGISHGLELVAEAQGKVASGPGITIGAAYRIGCVFLTGTSAHCQYFSSRRLSIRTDNLPVRAKLQCASRSTTA